jgi:hypothetical protein
MDGWMILVCALYLLNKIWKRSHFTHYIFIPIFLVLGVSHPLNYPSIPRLLLLALAVGLGGVVAAVDNQVLGAVVEAAA